MYLHCRYGGLMRTQLQKWGNSLAVRIPKAFAEDLGLGQDSAVDLVLEDGCMVVRPAVVPRYELGDLLSRVCEDNLHGEYDIGCPAGSEKW
jgi:antitoxin MazE